MTAPSSATSAVGRPCPCGLTQNYENCCGRWHGERRLQAPDALTLMRSRYTAFVLGDMSYLLDTWHPSTRPTTLDPYPASTKWLGLEVRRHQHDDENHAQVEFVARFKPDSKAVRLHEISRFVREQGQWFYVDGDFVESARATAR